MISQTLIELIGYLGSLLVIVSMLMTSLIKLRIINTVGSVIFATYALIIHSYPTAIMQFVLIIINIINLYHLLNTKKDYSIISMNQQDAFLANFLEASNDDINNFFPDFAQTQKKPQAADSVYLICNGSVPAGVFIGTPDKENSINVKLDYTTPAYRDCSVGKYLYAYLAGSGIKKISAKSSCDAHEKYLRKMGFKKEADNFVKKL